MKYFITNLIFIALILLISSSVSSIGQQPFPAFPPKEVTNTMDRDQMLYQMGIKLPDLPPKNEDKNAPPNSWPVDKSKPEGNWTDSNKNTITRSPFGLWNNYSDMSGGFFPGPDSARVGDYTPIDLLKMKNGKTIKSQKLWWKKQRPEILRDLQEQLYGKIPDAADQLAVKWNVTSSESETDRTKFIQKEITGEIDISGYPEVRNRPVLFATLRVPANSSSRVPVMIIFGGFGNVLDIYWKIASPHGWGVCVFKPQTLQPDNGAGLTSYLIGLVNKGNWRKPDDWGTLMAWGWGVSRLIDYLETDSGVDSRRIGLSGHSRYGKATLVTMAFEPRVTIGFPSDAGSLGTKLNRRHWGQDLENSTGASEYHWMAGSFFKWAGEMISGQYLPRKIEECPVDAHSLLALCAPRPVFINGGTNSTWCDPYGMFMTAKYASPVYEFLGKKGLVMPDQKPETDKAYISGTIAYRYHKGGHTDGPEWPAFFEFADKELK